ncbi:MAG: transglycosylase SLT domain-containing protein [Thermoanaerobaculia bacterium]
MAKLRRALRYRLDGLTVIVMLLSMLMLNVLLFSAGFLVGALPGEVRSVELLVASAAPQASQSAPAPLRAQLAAASPQPFVMPRWVPPAEPSAAEPAPMLVAYRERATRDYDALIEETAYRESVPPYLVAAIMRVESNFDARAVSNKGARGLMQVMPATARRFGFDAERLHDPVHNIAAGATYLRWLLERYEGDLDRVLAAYNAGEGAVDRYSGIPPYKETQEFVKRVRAVLHRNATTSSV